MKSFVKMPPKYLAGFTTYRLERFKDFDYDPISETGMSYQYKLHFNLEDKCYVKYRMTIRDLIKKHGIDNGVISFKYHDATRDTLLTDDQYREAYYYNAAVEAIYSAQKIKNSDPANHALMMKNANEHIEKIKSDEIKEYLLKFVTGIELPEKDYHAILKENNDTIGSIMRFIGQAQFTIFLFDPIDPLKVANFIKLVMNDLNKLELQEGSIANTDLRIIESSKLITFRQQAFNDNPTAYVYGTDVDSKVQEENANKLQNEARNCGFYKALVKALNPEAKQVAKAPNIATLLANTHIAAKLKGNSPKNSADTSAAAAPNAAAVTKPTP